MSSKSVILILTLFSIIAFGLFIYPSINQTLRAEQSKFIDQSRIVNLHQEANMYSKKYLIQSDAQALTIKMIDKKFIAKALSLPGSVSVRIYYAKNSEGKSIFLIYGVDRNGKEMIASISPTCPGCGQ